MGNCFNKGTQKGGDVSPKAKLVANSSAEPERQLILSDRNAPTTMVLGAEQVEFTVTHSRLSQKLMIETGNVTTESTGPHLVLVPHQHTLFCERKQRVCTAVGRTQEMEVLQVKNLPKDASDFYWVRTTNAASGKVKDIKCDRIPGSNAHPTYTLQRDDVNMFIGFCFSTADGENFAENLVGPILPGPPRLLDFHIEGADQEGGVIVATGQYIGGYEGASEYWWMRISAAGQRTQISDPKPVPSVRGGRDDPSRYVLTPDDIGCTLKAKCRPIRDDGAPGEIFTSKSSSTIRSK